MQKLHYHSRLIVNEGGCLVSSPCVIRTFGKTPAQFLQQLHYWLTSKDSIGLYYHGQRWIYNSAKEWSNSLVVSESTIIRTINKLKDLGVLMVKQLNPNKAIRTNYYTINYEKLESLIGNTPNQTTAENHLKSLPVKMTPSSCQNDNMYTKITSKKINTISSEQVIQAFTCPEKKFCLKNQEEKQLSNLPASSLTNDFTNNSPIKKSIPTLMLEIWQEEVEKEVDKTTLTKKLSQWLAAAFKRFFDKSLTKWQDFCKSIVSSKLLMGKITNGFRPHLSWILKFDTISRILAGDLGCIKKHDTLKVTEELEQNILQEIDQVTDGMKQIKRDILRIVGAAVYSSWLRRNVTWIKTNKDTICLVVQSSFIRDYIETHLISKIHRLYKCNVIYK